jgi:hypothetical protein
MGTDHMTTSAIGKWTALAASALLLACASFASTSASASEWKFKVYNKSQTAAVEFRTQEDGEWSSNWISDRIEPGDKFDMDFGHADGSCSVRTQIRFTDGTYFDAAVDYCKVSNLYIFEQKLQWD